MVRLKSIFFAALLVFLGTVLGMCWHWPTAGRLQAQIAGLQGGDSAEDRQAAYAALDRDVKVLERSGQVLSVVKRVAKLTVPFVAHVEARKPEGSRNGRGRSVEEAGAGIIIERQRVSYVITNRHVIRDAPPERISIELEDGRELQPVRIFTDPDSDVAVMSLPVTDVVTARFGDSRHIEVGDHVLAVGSPFGLSHSVSLGIISAKGRRDLKLGGDTLKYQDFIQTDAAINPGNSGGPLVNFRGEVIAMNTAIASASGINEGIGFGIPINMVLFVARQLIDHGTVRRARLGVSLDREFSAEMARDLGLHRLQGTRLTQIEPGSPAEAAGLQVGDVVLELDGVLVESDVHLVNLVSMTPVGQSVTLSVLRKGRRIQLTCKLVERPRTSQNVRERTLETEELRLALHEAESWKMDALGVEVIDVTPEIQRRLRLSSNISGALIARVDPAGPLFDQVQRGDIIDRIDQQPVRGVQDMHRILAQADAAEEFRVHILPGQAGSSQPRTVLVQPGIAYR